MKISKYILGFFAVIYLSSGISALIFSNFTAGGVISTLMGVYLCLYASMPCALKSFLKTKFLKIVWHFMLAGCIVVIAFSSFLEIYGRCDTTTGKEDAVIVLGAAVKNNKISLALKSRLDKAYEYLQTNPDALVVVSGGMGDGEKITEAQAMKNYLVSLGADESRIIKEEESTSTYENFKLSKKILDKKLGENYKTVIITNNFHVFRASQMARDAGLNFTHAGSDIFWLDIASNCSRETFAFFKYAVLGK